MKTKQPKEETDKSIDEDTVEPKTRARKKASDLEEEKSKASQDEAKIPQETKKPVAKPKGVIRKRPLGIRKTKKLRSKKVPVIKKNVIKQKAKRGRKPLKKPDNSQEKEAIPLIPASEIKKEPVDDTTPNSRSSSPKTAGRRSRLSSDMLMMKSVLGDSPSSLILGPRTSPYSMRSERSNSPSLFEGKNLRSGKPRKLKNNLLNEVVIKEQKKRTRLPSDSKQDMPDSSEDCKRLKRGRSCSRDGSEISKCSDITESDISLNETLTEPEKELNKKTDKPKTELDVDIDTNVQISTIEKVPSPNVDSKPEIKPDPEPSSLEKDKRRLSLKRSTSLDSDNNNSNRVKINNLNTADIELKLFETENDTLLEDRSSILNCMSKTFNSKEVSKNIRKARRGKKTATTPRAGANQVGKSCSLDTEISEPIDTVDSLSKEITDLIHNLDQNIDCDQESTNESNSMVVDQMQSKSVRQFYGLSKPLGDNNSIVSETPAKEKEASMQIANEGTPIKDDSENIRLHYEDSEEKSSESKPEITYKRATVASIDKLMDRLKEFEEFDKRRKRQQSESKSNDKTVMVTNDVVLIPKSGADIKPLKDMQPEKSPERFIEKENVLSCFENNSAISIVKRDQVRRSIDVDLPNSVTLIKRNSVSARKESTSSNHSKESDAISIFEKSLGKDVTLTEIRKSVDKPVPSPQVDLHQFATLQPNNPTQTIGGVTLDSSQISITPRNVESKLNCSDIQIMKRNSRESISRKSSGSSADIDDKMATLEKIKSPQQIKKFEVSITPTPVAVKSPEVTQPVETEALAPPLVDVRSTPENISSSESVQAEKMETVDIPTAVTDVTKTIVKSEEKFDTKPAEDVKKLEPSVTEKPEEAKTVQPNKPKTETSVKIEDQKLSKPVTRTKSRSSTEMPGPSNLLHETPESQKRKENVLRTLGLLTHKAASEAKARKLKEKELIYGANYNIMGKGKASKSDYTGTLKTVIKLNRGDKKRHRSSLKMTFQKSKHRGKPLVEVGEAGFDDDAYYTIERREGVAGATLDGGHRKSYSNRSNNHDTEAAPEPDPKETVNLVIPEKASSFSIHPGRLCMDQCFYCGGKFGLFDTPCHIAQMKSSERQKKVLDNEEKLTIDSCLCDACYRHVDRRANCPSYRKRPMVKQLDVPQPPSPPNTAGTDKPVSPPLEEEIEEEPSEARKTLDTCHTSGCVLDAEHCLRRKWLIKMRSSVDKVLKLDRDYPGLHTIPLCDKHYRVLEPLMACVLCRRRLTKHHYLHFIYDGYTDLNPMLKEAGIPVQFTERPVLCKLCRYYCTLLQRPGYKDNQARAYRRKLLEIYDIDIPPELKQQTEDNSALEDCNNVANRQKKKPKIKIKQRKSTEPETSESSERTTESSPEKEKLVEETEPHKNTHLEEDIESLISSNKIPVPGAKPPESAQSDCSESEMAVDETQLIGVDKQTELRYLLQKQNNPARFQKLNLTQKSRNILKVQNVGIQKVGQQHRIADKNVKRVQKLGQIVAHKEKPKKETEIEEFETDKPDDVIKNISLNDECTIETIPNKRPADINTLKNKWQLSESFSQVKKNLSELSKKIDKDPKKPTESKYSNPVKRLETNPSISVRELFPGEEEMNLQCNVEFNNVKGVTPAGWEKCNSLIQFDVETKKLWNELQRPYGNQSSFLRHLILLEKYFRSGDLILSHNASPHAANYNNSMQKRLKAYDNVATPAETPKTSSLIEFRKKPSVNGKSLLKSSQNPEKKFMPPPDFTKPSPKSKKTKQLPPELIAINTPNAQGRKAIQNVLHNIQQLVKGVSASDPTEVAAAPLPPPKFEPPKEKKEPPKEQKEKPKEPKEKKEPKKPKSNNKGWRPTLMPITQENVAKIAREPLKTAVDGHSLPSLVQVISSGNRYHISFEDYNKMCLIRKERQQRLHEKKATKPSTEETSVVTEVQTSAMLGNGGTVVQNITTEKDETTDVQLTTNAATILKNVGLKNITIAPIPPKTSTMTSQTLSLVTSQPLSAVTPHIVTNTVKPLTAVDNSKSLPKIPKSLTVIPQVVPQIVPVVTTAPSQTDSRP